MDLVNQLILIGAGLITLSIFAGLASSRIGAPLLLVFLVLGMLAGEDGPGGLEFDDFAAAYVVGSIALAVILFDGGLRTTRASFRLAVWPSLLLATLGVAATAAITGIAAKYLLGIGWIEGFLVGSIVASTDAAAVFFLLNQRNVRLKERVSATLEVESGINDPMAIFLTIVCIELLINGAGATAGEAAGEFAILFAAQILGGLAFGVAGGFALLLLVNRLQLASGLYPVLALSFALVIFGAAQTAGASGFLAAYLTGLILGNYRHRATQIINRFQDGLAWLAQIVMFLMLGLLVTPTALVPVLLPALAIAVVLILLARPIAVLLCLAPFRYSWAERAFVSWVGLRGAVPIFLGTMPILAGIEGATTFFAVAYVVVVASLLVQGWTVTSTARWLGLDLPSPQSAPLRVDMDLPAEIGRDMAGYTVQALSPAAERRPDQLPLPPETDVISVIRDGAMQHPRRVGRLAVGDYVILIVPAERLAAVDRLFAPGERIGFRNRSTLGEFTFDAGVRTGAVADVYGFPVPEEARDDPLGAFLAHRLPNQAVVGDRLRLGEVELVAAEMADGRITKVGIELEPQDWRLWPVEAARAWLAPVLSLVWRRTKPPALPAPALDSAADPAAPEPTSKDADPGAAAR